MTSKKTDQEIYDDIEKDEQSIGNPTLQEWKRRAFETFWRGTTDAFVLCMVAVVFFNTIEWMRNEKTQWLVQTLFVAAGACLAGLVRTKRWAQKVRKAFDAQNLKHSVRAPNGKVYNFSSKAQADAFRKKAGIR
jgi:high-affinity Fe2+/Pb2+ permease